MPTCEFTAATASCRALAKLAVKLVDPQRSSTRAAESALNLVLPFLLQKGITSEAEDVRLFSLIYHFIWL